MDMEKDATSYLLEMYNNWRAPDREEISIDAGKQYAMECLQNAYEPTENTDQESNHEVVLLVND